MRSICSLVAFLAVAFAAAQAPLELRIIHTNDLHAHPESFTISGKSYGGYARQATAIKTLRAQKKNSILLSAGDTFQGTMYFNTYQGLADLACMNAIGYQAACTGNHEFDLGPSALLAFATGAMFPVLACNIKSTEPAFSNLIKPSTVLTVDGQKIGIIGAVTPEMPTISSPGPTIQLLDLVPAIQGEVDKFQAEGVNKIILLSHIGYVDDQAVSKQTTGIDVIVGGHSHTPLGTPDLPGWRKSEGPYPTYVNAKDGKRVPIVQAYEWSKVVGHLDISFDAKGEVTKVDDAGVTVIDESIAPDPLIASMVEAFKKPIAARMDAVVTEAFANFPHSTDNNVIANAVTDAMMEQSELKADVALVNGGGVRAAIDAGPVTYGEILSVSPFGNTMTTIELHGSEFKDILEEGAPDPDKLGGLLFPSKEMSYTLDLTKPAGSRVSEIMIGGHPLDQNGTYTILINNFTATGGDAHTLLKNATGTRKVTDLVDVDLLEAWFAAHKPATPDATTRVKVIR